jgi:apolipoprotein N-acyltransferase
MSAAEAARATPAVLKRHARWCALALGALQSLAFAPYSIAPLGILCLAGLWWLWLDATPRRAAQTGFAFAAGLFLTGTYWLYTSIHVFGQAPLALALLLMLGLVAIMGTYGGVLGWLLARIAPPAPLLRLLALFPAGWVLMEWFRGWFLSGFPWLSVGYSQIDTPLAGLAPLVGAYGVSLAAAVTAGLLVALFATRGRTRVIVVIAAVVLYAGGALLARIEWTKPAGAALSVALVQGAISQDLKWQADNRERTLEIYRTMTDQALGARIVVWPEAALPELYHEAVPFLTPIYQAAQARGSDLVLGMLRYEFATEDYHNGLVALGQAEEWYYKRRLVPFGEFFPVPPFIREWMRLKSLAYVDFRAGPPDQPALDAAGQKLGATICYEDAYGVEQLPVLATATLLVNVSNDAWFGDSTAPHQHLQIARMRALEAGRWLMRATNNGISAFVDPAGHVVARSRQFVPEVLKGSVVPYSGLTPYARLRNWPLLGACLALLAAAGVGRRRGSGARGERAP